MENKEKLKKRTPKAIQCPEASYGFLSRGIELQTHEDTTTKPNKSTPKAEDQVNTTRKSNNITNHKYRQHHRIPYTCQCGFTAGTETAFHKHLNKNKNHYQDEDEDEYQDQDQDQDGDGDEDGS